MTNDEGKDIVSWSGYTEIRKFIRDHSWRIVFHFEIGKDKVPELQSDREKR